MASVLLPERFAEGMTVLKVPHLGYVEKRRSAKIPGVTSLKSGAISSLALVVLSTVGAICGAQSTSEDDAFAKETQARGYWVDLSTGLMWAAKDNGKNVNWHQATKYCHRLRVGGYADWRLATIEELEGLIDVKAYAPEHVGDSSILHFNFSHKVHGDLLLTGQEWSSSQRLDDRGKPSGIAWYFDFINVRMSDDDGDVGLLDNYHKRALCVRDSMATPSAVMGTAAVSAPENQNQARQAQVSASYSDPATGLMWAGKDNSKDVNFGEALKYCHDLRADGHSGWRIATIEELEGIQELDGKSPDGAITQEDRIAIGHGAGKPVLTGDPWSSSPVAEAGGVGEYRWYLSLKSGTRVFDDPSFSRGKRAVCVHDPLERRGDRPGAPPSSLGPQRSELGTQERGYWIDPATGLMWAARDSLGGSPLYIDATSFCQRLRLAGHADWRLATVDELKGIHDPEAESPGAIPRSRWQQPEAASFHVKGNLFLTGVEWVNTSDNDDRNPSQYRLIFDFKNGKLLNEKRYFVHASALCVRRAGE
jgi:Protein of unknown function (DUF1566)